MGKGGSRGKGAWAPGNKHRFWLCQARAGQPFLPPALEAADGLTLIRPGLRCKGGTGLGTRDEAPALLVWVVSEREILLKKMKKGGMGQG